MQLHRVFAKFQQAAQLPPAEWARFVFAFCQRRRTGLIPCVLPGTREILQVPARDFEESYRFFAEAPLGRQELGYFLGKLRPGDVLFDVGAFRGAYGFAAKARLGRQVCVHFFEPLPENLGRLKAVGSANPTHGFVLVDRALGNGAAIAGSTGEHAMLRNDGIGATQVFPSTSVDAYIAEAGVIPTVLKIDVEGFEGAVLEGAVDCLTRHRPRIWLELHEKWLLAQGRRWESLLERLRAFGYQITFFADFDLPTRSRGFHVWCEA